MSAVGGELLIQTAWNGPVDWRSGPHGNYRVANYSYVLTASATRRCRARFA